MPGDLDFRVYALKLQPSKETGFFDPCRDEKVIGIGWDPGETEDSVEALERAHKQIDRNQDKKRTIKSGALRHEIRYLLKEMSDGSDGSSADYVWVNEGSEFALCQVTSRCKSTYNVEDELREKLTNENRTRMYHIRGVDWTDIPVEFVPGYVKRKFTGRFGTITRMKKGVDAEAKRVIQELHDVDDFASERAIDFDKLTEDLESAGTDVILDILDADDTEEVVLDYLQAEGWRITKYSTGDSQATYECELRRVSDGEREAGFVQVKSGDATLTPSEYFDLAEDGQVYLFANTLDSEQKPDREDVTIIDPDDLVTHIQQNTRWLPTPTLLRLQFSLRTDK